MEIVTKTVAFVPGFVMSGLEGSGATAAAMWRPTTAAATAAAGNTAPAATTAQHKTVAISQNVKLATLHTDKQHVVTTPDAGRDNKGTSPWGFPV